MKKSHKYLCCICGKEQEGIGYNPGGLGLSRGDRCCRMCRIKIVLPFNKMEERYAEGII